MKLSDKYYKEMEKYKKTPEYAAHALLVKEYKLQNTKKPFRKDENAPKRPPTGYLLWVNENRAKYVKENPDVVVTDVMTALAAMWKELSDSERQKYIDKAAKFRATWIKDVEKYQKTDSYTAYQEEKAAYKAKQSRKRDRLIGDDKSAKRAKKGKSPKRASKSRSRSRSSRKARRGSKAAKVSRTRAKKRSARASKKPKAPKRASSSLSRSRSRSAKKSARAAAKPKGKAASEDHAAGTKASKSKRESTKRSTKK